MKAKRNCTRIPSNESNKVQKRGFLYDAGAGEDAFVGDDEPGLANESGKTESMAAVRLLRLSRLDRDRER